MYQVMNKNLASVGTEDGSGREDCFDRAIRESFFEEVTTEVRPE